jgi:Spy/CpxP family protein refolding chaperone
MNRFLYPTGAILLIVAGVVGLASANFSGATWSCVRGRHGAFPLAYLSHELNLSEPQQTQIKSIWAQERATAIPLMRQLLTESANMPSAQSSGQIDESLVRVVAQKEAVTLSQLLMERERLISRIYTEVLTPDQREKADQLRDRMHERAEKVLDRIEHVPE